MTWRVLVVDDDPQIRDALERALSRVGYEVLTAEGGDSAYAILAGSPVDAVLLDLLMPHLPGDALFLAILRRWPRLKSRVVLMSGHPEASHREWPEELKACPLLVKPFRLRELYAAVAAVLPAEESRPLKRNHGQG